jgi:NAD(P)-dependent dehydrogenase (short-subunit alcohol dehydrogenase family)
VNNAGASRAHFGEIPDEEWEDSLAINFLSAVRVTNPALTALKEAERGSIINVTTGITHNPPAPLMHCGAAKAALESWSKGLATQLAPSGVRVDTVTLGMVDTPGGGEVLETVAGAMGGSAEKAYASVPLGRGGDARDVAELIRLPRLRPGTVDRRSEHRRQRRRLTAPLGPRGAKRPPPPRATPPHARRVS